MITKYICMIIKSIGWEMNFRLKFFKTSLDLRGKVRRGERIAGGRGEVAGWEKKLETEIREMSTGREAEISTGDGGRLKLVVRTDDGKIEISKGLET